MNWENGAMNLKKHFMNGSSLSVPVHIPSRLDQRGFYFTKLSWFLPSLHVLGE